MTTLSESRLRELKQIAERSTSGPWRKGGLTGRCTLDHSPHGRGTCDYRIALGEAGGVFGETDADFIAAFDPATAKRLVELAQRYVDAVKNGLIDDEEVSK
jgi:hypothetical protein